MWYFRFLSALFLIIFMSGCTAKRNCEALRWDYQFRSIMAQRPALEGSFSITPCGEPFYPPGLNPIYSKQIACQFKASGLTPNIDYILFCPNTGDPYRPELEVFIQIDENGDLYIPANGYPNPAPPNSLHLELVTIPGFASDWYLISNATFNFNQLHCTFNYQPILAKTSDGKELMLCKKDCGGNFLEISLKGFAPHEKVVWVNQSEDHVFSDSIIMDETGSGAFMYRPKISRRQKGKVTISIPHLNEPLQASCDWNYDSLTIKRLSSPSLLRLHFKNLPYTIQNKCLIPESLH